MKTSSSAKIRVPLEKVFKYASNPANLSSYISCMNEVKNINPKEPGLGQAFDWKFNLGGVILKGKAEITSFLPPNSFEVQTSGNVFSVWNFSFMEIPEGTEFSLSVDYEIKSKYSEKIGGNFIVDKLCEMLIEQIVQNLKVIKEARN